VWLIAKRFLGSRASGGFLSFISLISVVGVGLGVLALVSVTSVINGFEGELVRSVTGLNGEVLLFTHSVPVGDADAVMAKVRRVAPETVAVTPSFLAELMVSGPQGAAGALLEGVDLATVGTVTDIPQRLVKGALPAQDDEVVLGTTLADKLGVGPGGTVRLVAPFAADGQPATVTRRVSGVVRLGYHEYDSKYVIGTLDGVRGFLGQPGKVTTFKLKLKHGADPGAVARRLSDDFGYPYRAKEWARLNRNLLYATQVEKATISVILTIIVIVAAFNVVSTLLMMIHDKVRDIAILKAMGLNRQQVFRLFCLIGLGIGCVGTAVGIGAGVGMDRLLERSGLLNLPPEIYHLSSFPVRERWNEVAVIAGVAILITFLAAVYPAFTVARRAPLEGIRHE
jgi:lipoprotein-releasing system permease protein